MPNGKFGVIRCNVFTQLNQLPFKYRFVKFKKAAFPVADIGRSFGLIA